MLERALSALSTLVARAPGRWLLGWLLLACFGLLAGTQLDSRLTHAAGPPPGSESAQVREALKRHFPQEEGALHLVVLHHPSQAPRSAAFEATLAALRERLAPLPVVRSVTVDPALGALRVVTTPETPGIAAVPALRRAIAESPIAAPFEVSLTGSAAASADLHGLIHERLGQIERIALVISAFVLAYVFGSWRLVGLALGSGLVGLAVLPLAIFGLSLGGPVSSMTLLIAAVMTLTLGLDYPLFFLQRVREEYAGDMAAALRRASASAGRAIAVAGTAIGLAGFGMLAVPLADIRAVALTMVLTGVIAVGLTLTALPAALLCLERRGWLGAAWTRPARTGGPAPLRAIVEAVTARPRRALCAAALVLGALIFPLLQLRTWTPTFSMLPASLEARRGLEHLLAREDGGAVSPLVVVWHAPGPRGFAEAATLEALRHHAGALRADARVGRVEGLASLPGSPEALAGFLRSPLVKLTHARFGLSADGHWAVMRLSARRSPDSPEAARWVGDMRRLLAPVRPLGAGAGLALDRSGASPAGETAPSQASSLQAWLGGAPAEQADVQAAFARGLPGVLVFNVVAVVVLLGFYLRSVVLPLKAVLTNLLPVLAGLGVVTAVFQWGWAGSGAGYVQAFTVTVVLSFLFAVSLDYEIFMLSRIREAYDAGLSHEQAIVEGLGRAGRVILGAALVLLSVFVPCLLVDLPGLRELGLALTVAIALDATLVRLVLVPAMLRLMGRWNYWTPRFGLPSVEPFP